MNAPVSITAMGTQLSDFATTEAHNHRAKVMDDEDNRELRAMEDNGQWTMGMDSGDPGQEQHPGPE